MNSEIKSEIVTGEMGIAIDLFLQNMEEEAYFTGAVFVEEKGETLLCKGYGKANDTSRNSPLTSFHIASLTKQFTAAAIIKLVEAGKIDLQASINNYLPYQCCSDQWEDVTVEELLNHTSGIRNYVDWDDYWKICKHLTADKIIEDIKEEELLFAPGADVCYSNTGYTLLGKIIEQQTHMSYGEFIKQKLLLPAQMTSSGIHDQTYSKSVRTAEGYYIENEKLVKDPRDEFSALYSDGSLYSTVGDMAKWSRVLDGKTEVLSQKVIRQIIEGQYGLIVDRAFGHLRIHHNGSMAGFRSNFCKYPDAGICIIILGNNADFIVDYLVGRIAKALLEPASTLPSIIHFPSDFNYAPYLKEFESEESEEDEEDEGLYVFKLHHKQLFLQGENRGKCFLLSNQRLYVPTEGMEYELQKNGKIFVFNGEGEREDILRPIIFQSLWH